VPLGVSGGVVLDDGGVLLVAGSFELPIGELGAVSVAFFVLFLLLSFDFEWIFSEWVCSVVFSGTTGPGFRKTNHQYNAPPIKTTSITMVIIIFFGILFLFFIFITEPLA
jgi:hypothetical protein